MQQPKAVTDLIDKGLAAQQGGDTKEARAQYEAALSLSTNDPEALHLLGLVHEQENDRPGAIAMIERAIAVDPAEPIFRINLAAILEKDRQFDAAAEHIRAAVNARPQSSDLATRLGDIELQRNDAANAAAAFKSAFQLDQNNAAALAGYGRAMMLAGNLQEARRAAQAAINQAPTDIACLELALRLACVDRDGRAITQFSNIWKTVKSNDKDALVGLSNLLFDLGYTNEACASYESVVALDPNSAETLIAYGRHCTAAQKLDLAEEAINKALAIDPNSATGIYALGRVAFFRGDFEATEEYCNRVFASDPTFSPALTQLCSLRRGDMSDAQLEAMRNIAEDTRTEPAQIFELLLSIGRVLEKRGDIEEAFANIAKGNDVGEQISRLNAEGFDRRRCETETAGFRSFYNEPSAEHDFAPIPYVPIFVVGMPRSGTTLTESILTAHPDVFSIGELSSLPAVAKDVFLWKNKTNAKSIAEAPKDQLQAWRDLYFSYFPTDNPESHMVDKQPINFQHAGLIRALFPEGKIAHVRRDPVETGFSIYRHPFNKGWPFSYKLEDIAFFYGNYAQLTAHWEATLGADYPLFQYENLIADFEPEVRRLLGHCGLSWHDGCLSFHQSKRAIATFSSVQARQPVSKTPKRAAQKYAAFLSPLMDGLAAVQIDLETGALIDDAAP